MRVTSLLWAGSAVAAAITATPSFAQSAGSGQSVADRPRPGYDPIGSRLGAFTVLPSITVTGNATDNYLATETNRRSDAYLVVAPEVYVRSNWSRDRLEGRAFYNRSFHANLPGENVSQFGAGVSGIYNPLRETQVSFDLGAARYYESRSSLGALQGSAEPVRFEDYRFSLGVSQGFNDLILGLNGSVNRRDYHDVPFAGGAILDQDYRDVRAASFGASAKYDLRNGIGLIVSAGYDSERYDVRPGKAGFLPGYIDRDSSGFNVQGGVQLELTRLIFGTLTVGYLSRNYEDPTLRDFTGLSFSGDVLWNVTPLTSVRFRASRSIQDSSSPLIAGNTRSDFRVAADHELYRYVIVSGDIGYGRFRPNGIGIGGDEYSAGVGVRYLLDRNFSVTGAVRHSRRDSDSSFLRFNATTGTIGVRAQF